VSITDAGRQQLHAARRIHRDGIQRHFAEHLQDGEHAALAGALERVRRHVRPLRPGRVSS
jgi:hypothetical protein